jgi:glycosyltransferase involved in cell wall biosynthesis
VSTVPRILRFCLLSTFYPPFSFGGDAIQVERLAAALAERGHQVTVVHSRQAFETLSKRRPDGGAGDSRVKVLRLESGLGPVAPVASYLTGRPISTAGRLEALFEEDFDVLHFHNPSLIGAPGAFRLGKAIKLYTAHEQWLVCPTHVLWKYQQRVCERPTCWRCSLTYRRPPQLWRSGSLLRDSVAELDALILPSETSMRLHKRFAPIVRLEHIPHFVPDSPASEPTPPERPYFLFAGRLEPIKGAEVAIDAMRGRPEQLLIAGSGTLERKLRRRAEGLDNVRFVGWVDSDRLDGLYRNALAVIVPTLGHEAFGLVAVEAFARGTPAIVHHFGALGELVDTGGGGVGYRTGEELQNALTLVADPDLHAQLAQRARAAYEREWTTDRHVGRYLRLIAELADAKGDEELAAAASQAAGPLVEHG